MARSVVFRLSRRDVGKTHHDTRQVALLRHTPRYDGCGLLLSVETRARASVICCLREGAVGGSFLRVAVEEVRHAVGALEASNGLVSITMAEVRTPRNALTVSHDGVWLTLDESPIERTFDAVLIRTRCG